MKVKEAMHAGVEWVDPNISIMDLAKKMREDDIGAVPVGENDRVIGMVTDRDIACRAVATGADPAQTRVRDIMTKGVTFCGEDDDLEQAVHIMEEKQIRRLPVLNDSKRMVGMLTLGDLSHAASHELSGEATEAVTGHH